MDGVKMRKRNKLKNFFQRRQYEIASFVLFFAVAGMTGIYISNRITSQQRRAEEAREKISQEADLAFLEDEQKMQEEDVASVSSVIKPKEEPTKALNETTGKRAESILQEKPDETLKEEKDQEKQEESGSEQLSETKADVKGQKETELHFSPDKGLIWPLQGDVILNYSMDQTVYFATLDQYKYNPALIIAGEVNAPVNAAAAGIIKKIETNEETGLTVTTDLGDGYEAIYGQLKEVVYKEGATVEAGSAIGYVAEPTKYYSVEGSNLYFELRKDGKPINPVGMMQIE